MKNLIRRIAHPIYKRYHFWYHRKPRKYTYNNIYTIVQPTVFSPINTVSTKVFLDYIDTIELNNKTVLELGCGSGIISIFSASKGSEVTATDINKTALNSLKKVSENQGFDIDCIYSDLFDEITKPNKTGFNFDYIFINPPYYPKKPRKLEEEAWFCGANFEYFEELFNQLPTYLSENTNCYMILSDDCNIKKIKEIAKKNHVLFNCVLNEKKVGETNFILKLMKNAKKN